MCHLWNYPLIGTLSVKLFITASSGQAKRRQQQCKLLPKSLDVAHCVVGRSWLHDLKKQSTWEITDNTNSYMETLRFNYYYYNFFDFWHVWVSYAKLYVVVTVLPTSYLNACLSHKMFKFIYENVECSKYNFLWLWWLLSRAPIPTT